MTAFVDGSYESANGLLLYYRSYRGNSAGVPVLCLPGITRNSRDFVDLAVHLSDRHPVITPDFRGRGQSAHDPEWRNYFPRTYVDDVVRLLDVLEIRRAAFVGTSLGGLVATALAAERPDLVAGIVLNDIGPEIGEHGLARIKEYIGRARPVANWSEAKKQLRETYELAWPDLPDSEWESLARLSYRENEQGVPEPDMDPMIGEAARQVGTGLDDPWKLFDALQSIPVLVLQGELSDMLTDAIVEKMRERKPDLLHVKVRNRGHVPLLNEPDCLPLIDNFLDGIS